MAKIYKVKKGDNLWTIAKNNNMDLNELLKLNPNINRTIHPNDIIKLEPEKITKVVNIRQERERERKFNLDNVQAIQNAQHDGNYVIIDKKNRNLTIFDRNNNPLYSTDKIATGASGNDYNTITYVDKSGKIKDKQGNNSTPAGITVIDGVGTYHGYPTFIRSRINKDGSTENIASSLHFGNIGKERKASNGCVRVAGKTLEEMAQYIDAGTKVYTLPEKEGSKFTLKGGALNFTAKNPYGVDKGDKRFWDDYNINIDKTYQPLKFKWNKTGNEEYDNNRKQFAQALVDNKKQIQKEFNLTSDEYNRFAEMALGLAEQETKFGTATSYKAKKALRELYGDNITDNVINPIGRAARQIINLQTPHNISAPPSRGLTQIKLQGDNEGLENVYNKLGISTKNIDNIDKSAVATIARLAYMYNTEIKGRNFVGQNNKTVDPYDALLYKWNGHNEQLTKHLATPNKNRYLNNIKKYGNNFDMYETRTYNKYKLGGSRRNSIRNVLGAVLDPINTIRQRAYNTINPFSDYNIVKNFKEFVDGKYMDYGNVMKVVENNNNKYLTEFGDGIGNAGVADDIWATYLQIPKNKRRFPIRIKQSNYKPSSGNQNEVYYKLPLEKYRQEELINETNNLPIGKNNNSEIFSDYNLGVHTIGRGHDKKGEYRSYYDRWDLNPFNGKYSGINIPILNALNDVSFGIGKPVNIYDRIYLDDYYGVPKNKRIGASYLPEVKVVGVRRRLDSKGKRSK